MLLFLQIERKVQICMKKSLAIFLSVLALTLTSCFDDVEDGALSPYALLESFSIGNITSEYPVYASDGSDSTATRTIEGSSYPFSINQFTGEVYNADSLPYATRVDKVVVDMKLTGYVQINVKGTDDFESFSASDSIDFTSPRKFRVTASDSEYYRDYTVSVNVHKVQPEQMVWECRESDGDFEPLRALEYDGSMCLFGKKGGQPVLAVADLQGTPLWQQAAIKGLPESADLATVNAFGDALFMVAADGIYTSVNGVDWSLCHPCDGAVAIVGVSDVDGKMWVATGNGLLFTTDGLNYESAGALPAGFPLYGVSIASYRLKHNSKIVRYMLVGYTTEAMDGDAVVWSRLSTEDGWVKYENENNPFACPSLKGLSVLRYDDFLYAVGGAGVAQNEKVGAFSSFYISRDNGITWKAPEGFYQRIPADLQDEYKDAPFAATVDSNNVMWIVRGGEKPLACKGIINRLGFKN